LPQGRSEFVGKKLGELGRKGLEPGRDSLYIRGPA
jgi:hypothetical protein